MTPGSRRRPAVQLAAVAVAGVTAVIAVVYWIKAVALADFTLDQLFVVGTLCVALWLVERRRSWYLAAVAVGRNLVAEAHAVGLRPTLQAASPP